MEDLKKLSDKYNLSGNDLYKHRHYHIITRQGIDKIQAIEKINIKYDVVKCEVDFAAIKATAIKDELSVETFGSAKYGGKFKNEKTGKWEEKGNTTTWYILEMAEKRAMSRAVLKLTGFYELGVFGEDESEDFKVPEIIMTIELDEEISNCKNEDELKSIWINNPELHTNKHFKDAVNAKKKLLNK